MFQYVDLEKKTVDWHVDRFPEENPFDVKVKSLEEDEEIQLYNYRWKSQKESVKAVIMLFHGYGSWTGKYGYYGKYFADQGYDFVGFDFRGFGNTKGQRGHIDSWEQHLKDCWNYYDTVRADYDENIPIIGCGYSLGGGTTYSLAIQRPDAFKALIQLAPFAGYQFVKHPAHFLSEAIYK
jgi:alpha-beta hydrolase superfamily lysophospholipase